MEHMQTEAIAERQKSLRRSRIIGAAVGAIIGTGAGMTGVSAFLPDKEVKVVYPEDIFEAVVPCGVDDIENLQMDGEPVVLVDGRCQDGKVLETPLKEIEARRWPDLDSDPIGSLTAGRFVVAVCTQDVYEPTAPEPKSDTALQVQGDRHVSWVRIKEGRSQAYVLAAQVLGESELPGCSDPSVLPNTISASV